jgi:hypothetical protein
MIGQAGTGLDRHRLLAGWRRRAAIGLGVVGLYAVLGFLVVPAVARAQIVKLARTLLHREATVAKVSFNPFTLAATVSGLDLRDRDGAALLSFDRLAVDLELSGVLRRAWRFREIRLEQPRVELRVLADGRLSFADLLQPKPGPAEPGKGGMPRVIVDRLVVDRGAVAVSDASRTPAYATVLEPLGVDLHDLTTIPREKGEHAVTIGITGGAEIRWTGTQTVEPLRLDGRIEIVDISLPRVWEYVGYGQPLEVGRGTAELALSYSVTRGSDGEYSIDLSQGKVALSGLAVRPRGSSEEWLALDRLAVTGVVAAWPARRLAADELRLERPHVLARLAADGRLNWLAALPAPPAAAAPKQEQAAPVRPWLAKIGAIVVEGGSARIEDESVAPPVHLDIGDAALRVTGVSTDLAAPLSIDASVRLPASGSASVHGTLTPQPLSADLAVALDKLDLPPLRSYIAALPNATLAGGSAGAKGALSLRPAPAGLQFDGAAWLDAVELKSPAGERWLACRSMRADGIRLTTAPARVRVRSVAIDRGYATIHIDKQGNLNLTQLLAAAPTAAAPPPAGGPALPVYVGAVRFLDSEADYTDESLVLPFGTRIHALNGAITDLATVGAAAASLKLEGRVDEIGFVKVDGTLRVADPLAASDIGVAFRSIPMKSLTPYTAQFAGYAIERGSLDLDVRYRIHDRRLLGDHRVVATDLVLGNKVGGTSAGFAVRLAIALLKDKDGRIDLEVPVEGNIDSPEFAYSKVMWQAVKKILVNIVKAPFRALGRLFGRDEEDLELVDFEPGHSQLLAAEQDKLSRMAEEIGKRPELSLEVEGRYDAAVDAEAIRKDRVDALIAARRETQADAAGGGTGVLDAILERLFTEQFGAAALAAERARFTAAAPPPPENAADARKAAKRSRTPASPPPAAGFFDATGFYDTLRARLVAAQNVEVSDLQRLARERGLAIATGLTASGAVAPTRIKALDPAPAKRKKSADSVLVASEMTLTTPR